LFELPGEHIHQSTYKVAIVKLASALEFNQPSLSHRVVMAV
jgi:hypothetical protein